MLDTTDATAEERKGLQALQVSVRVSAHRPVGE